MGKLRTTDQVAAMRGLSLIPAVFAAALLVTGCEKKPPESPESPAPAQPAAAPEQPAAKESPSTLGGPDKPHAGMEGGISVKASGSVDDVVGRLEAAIKAKGLTLFSVIDHAGNARKVDLELRPTRLVIFGNPKIGTRLMQAGQTVAINLPMKMLVYEANNAEVYVVYEDPKSLAERHNLEGVDDVLGKVSGALAGLAKAAAGE